MYLNISKEIDLIYWFFTLWIHHNERKKKTWKDFDLQKHSLQAKAIIVLFCMKQCVELVKTHCQVLVLEFRVSLMLEVHCLQSYYKSVVTFAFLTVKIIMAFPLQNCFVF